MPIVLLGVLVAVAGFALRLNALLVVAATGVITGLLGGLDLHAIVSAFGAGFVESRYVAVFLVTLPIVGLLERYGLQEQARRLIASSRNASAGRVLGAYLVARMATCALGLLSVAGHAQTVRPVVVPMAEAAAERRHGKLGEGARERLRAFAAGVDNVGLFFGEDLFIAVGAILLMVGFFEQNGVKLEPLRVAAWGVPTALCALLVHGARIALLERRLAREAVAAPAGEGGANGANDGSAAGGAKRAHEASVTGGASGASAALASGAGEANAAGASGAGEPAGEGGPAGAGDKGPGR
ncbi:MAG TPA: DUF969 domain-containing protein [Polyangiaceae bacterium]|nr:DUF969 domain-containing protein [Polyangiaceae bacterium]